MDRKEEHRDSRRKKGKLRIMNSRCIIINTDPARDEEKHIGIPKKEVFWKRE